MRGESIAPLRLRKLQEPGWWWSEIVRIRVGVVHWAQFDELCCVSQQQQLPDQPLKKKSPSVAIDKFIGQLVGRLNGWVVARVGRQVSWCSVDKSIASGTLEQSMGESEYCSLADL